MNSKHKEPNRTFIKTCPDLMGYRIIPAVMQGGATVKVPVLSECRMQECAAYDPKTEKCKKYGTDVRYEKQGPV